MTDPHPSSRLTTLEAAWVIARRDFQAILFSRAFFFFLLGPLFPLIVGNLAGNIGGQVQQSAQATSYALAMAPADNARMMQAAEWLRARLPMAVPSLVALDDDAATDPRAILESRAQSYAAVISGTPAAPHLTGPGDQVALLSGPVGLISAKAARDGAIALAPVSTEVVERTTATARQDRIATAQSALLLLFLLTIILAGMVLSNLVEEKANKIIEVLAAAIPMDAVFMGKLFAMLGISFVGIAVWSGAFGLFALATGTGPALLPTPGVGWPAFIALGILYFALSYLLLGSIFLTVGALATTVREVQTLSMPVTMFQILVFFFATYVLTAPGSPMEALAMVFPLSSPFAMLARAALDEALWPHALALAWQGLCVIVFVRLGARLFRRRVMKSGKPAGRRGRLRSGVVAR